MYFAQAVEGSATEIELALPGRDRHHELRSIGATRSASTARDDAEFLRWFVEREASER